MRDNLQKILHLLLRLLPYLILLTIVFLVYKRWFLSEEIIGGDWPYFFNETLKEFSLFPPAWSLVHGNGLGGVIPAYYLDQYLYFTAYLFTGILHIPWVLVYKIFWFGLFISLSIFSSIYLLKTIFPQVKPGQIMVTAIIFTTNTYILMVVGGGQMGVALSYSLAPLVLAKFIQLSERIALKAQGSRLRRGFGGQARLKDGIISGLILALQLMFDPRIAYITMIAVVLYQILRVNKIYILIIPIGVAILLHGYWILPLLFIRSLPIPIGFESVSGFEFFSFADFPHAFSLLHPNWSENIFGKVYFMRAEFLILPIFAFSSLLFLKNPKSQILNPKQSRNSKFKIQNKNNIVISQYRNIAISFFAFLALLGAFLAKGANSPFREVNIWVFQYFPGMFVFRDPTKFYLLVVFSYIFLIPFTLKELFRLFKRYLPYYRVWEINKIVVVLFLTHWLFLIRPAWMGELGGTFRQHKIPNQYVTLKNFLYGQQDFFRTLWIPRRQRFSFVSDTHPAVEALPLFEATNSNQVVSKLQEPDSQKLLEELSVKYVIVPFDSLGEIFLKDRKYDEGQYQNLIRELEKILWLKKLEGFERIAIFEVPNLRDRFWLEGEGKVSYRMISPTQYFLSISTSRPLTLVFSENYSSYWIAKIGDKEIKSTKSNNGLNSFKLDGTSNFNVEVYFSQEKYYKYGRLLSLIAFLAVIIGLFLLKTKKELR